METKPKYADALKNYITEREMAREEVYRLFSPDYLVERISNPLRVKEALRNYRRKNDTLVAETLVAIIGAINRQESNKKEQNRALRDMLKKLEEEIKKEEKEIIPELARMSIYQINAVLSMQPQK